MPWIYRLRLTEYVSAGRLRDDWETTTPGSDSIQHPNGGVQVSGSSAVIVSERKDPVYQDIATLPYVRSVTEDRKIGSDKVYHLNGDEARDPHASDPL
jgi:hypothetical protein